MSDLFTIFKISKNENTKMTKMHDILADCMFNSIRISIFWSKTNPGTNKWIKLKNPDETSTFWPQKIAMFRFLTLFEQIIDFLRFLIFFQQKKRVAQLELLGFSFFPGVIYTEFSDIFSGEFYDIFFTKKWAVNLGITSETTRESWPGIPLSRVRRPCDREWDAPVIGSETPF